MWYAVQKRVGAILFCLFAFISSPCFGLGETFSKDPVPKAHVVLERKEARCPFCGQRYGVLTFKEGTQPVYTHVFYRFVIDDTTAYETCATMFTGFMKRYIKGQVIILPKQEEVIQYENNKTSDESK